jgi:hypothetical protein
MSANLLEQIANSLFDRNPECPVFFSVKEIHLVEDFLKSALTRGAAENKSPQGMDDPKS